PPLLPGERRGQGHPGDHHLARTPEAAAAVAELRLLFVIHASSPIAASPHAASGGASPTRQPQPPLPPPVPPPPAPPLPPPPPAPLPPAPLVIVGPTSVLGAALQPSAALVTVNISGRPGKPLPAVISSTQRPPDAFAITLESPPGSSGAS